MYFDDNFPIIPYDSVGNYQFKDVTNLLRRVGIRAKVKANTLVFDTYDVKNGETPESLAHKLYEDAELHWVILLTNDITDAYYGWPLSDQDFEKYITDKYSNPQGIHHYEITQSSGPQTGGGPSDFSHKIEVNDTEAGAESVSNYEYERREQDKLRSIKLLNPQFLGLFIEEFERKIQG